LAIPLIACCLGYTLFGFSHRVWKRRALLGVCAGVAVVTALAMELPYHLTSPPQGLRCQRLYIVSDSLAAGLGREQTTWPKLLAARTRVEVRDLSFAGANTRLALRSVQPVLEQDEDSDAWILISIGGNDMLGKTSAEDFATDLDRLLALARGNPAHPRRVLMQELPLVPGAWAFGAAQRRLAAQHGVALLPKKLLAGVVLTGENVVDGLHLSPAGHERMAQEYLPWVN
jgi:lysophospholipase L1-like esterase